MVVQHNLTAMNANRYLGINNNKLSKSLEKLASGYAINRAGDNAAGLAVSEKMRSQIAGMTQGVKNAQDGISMVQTFEGALTETHSILQRMKTLADQMANGSYDDAVDRTAAQQEFLQLNDELNQIADTDFNGVIVLNGGKMADGLEVNKNGQFNYREGSAPSIAAATAEAADLTTMIRDDADGVGMNVDDSAYGNKAANALWKALGLTSDASDLNVTFVKGSDADGNTTWSVGAAVATASAPGKVITPAVPESITTPTVDATLTGAGAAVADEDAMLAWVKQEATANGVTLADGDTIEITRSAVAANTAAWDISINGNAINGAATYKNAQVAGLTAPTGSVAGKISFTYNEAQEAVTEPATTVNEDITEKAISNLTIKEINAKDGASGDGGFEVSWEQGGETHTINVVSNSVDAKDGDYITVNFKPSALKAPTNIGVYEDNGAGVNFDLTAATGSTLTKDNVKIDVTIDNTVLNDGTMNQYFSDVLDKLSTSDITYTVAAGGPGAFVVNGANATGTTAGDFVYTDNGDGTMKIGYYDGANTVDFATVKLTLDGTEKGDETITFSLKPSAYNYSDADDLRARSVETTAAQKEIFDKNTDSGDYAVSTSNAFKNSEAILTYKDNITLQVGARTKDAVNFTFKYASTSIGDLKADLNCTAEGLGTDKLNINDQSAANYAIDKIDQAINKVSLIRGTFGAIQNRLEHKIDNMNVSIENLTSAESQIRDTNMPTEMMNFTKNQILAQASQSMLAQANQLPQGVLSLLQ